MSVCIPTYNRAAYLAECIESVLGQTFGDFEIIVSDDASTDDTEEVVRSYCDSRIRYLRNERNLGGPANWVVAFNAATAPYCAILGDDDKWAPQFLKALVRPLEAHPSVDVAFSDHWVIAGSGAVLLEQTDRFARAYHRDRLRPGEHQPFLEPAIVSQAIPVSAALLRRERVGQLRALDARAGLPLDYYLFAVLALGGGGAFYVPSRLAYSRAHDGTLRATRDLQVVQDMQWICSQLVPRVQPGRLRAHLRARWSRAASGEAYARLRRRERWPALHCLLRSLRLAPFTPSAWLRLLGAVLLACKPDLRLARPAPRPVGRTQ